MDQQHLCTWIRIRGALAPAGECIKAGHALSAAEGRFSVRRLRGKIRSGRDQHRRQCAGPCSGDARTVVGLESIWPSHPERGGRVSEGEDESSRKLMLVLVGSRERRRAIAAIPQKWTGVISTASRRSVHEQALSRVQLGLYIFARR